MLAFLAGLSAGLVHVFSGPDHLAAVAPLASSGHRPHWKAGLQWGLGHTAGVLMIGLLLLAFRQLLPIDALSAWSERAVGLALIAVGVWGVHRATQVGVTRLHDHVHGRASFAMGTLHGLAGSSHLFGVLPALAFASRGAGMSYLGGFGAGAVAGMTAFAALVGWATIRAERRAMILHRGLLYACSAAAVLVGGFWLVR